MTGVPLRTAVVMGGGVAGLWAAAALASAVAGLRVTLVEDLASPLQPLDCQSTLPPRALAALRAIGVSPSDLLAVGGRIRLGQWLQHGDGVDEPVLIPEGQVGVRIGFVPFARAWLEAARTGAPAPFAEHAVTAAMIARGRFAPPVADTRSPLSTFDHGINVDPAALRRALAAAALARGVQIVQAGIARVERSGTERLAAIVTREGHRLEADLFVDASGEPARLLPSFGRGEDRETWRTWRSAGNIWTGVSPADTAGLLADMMIRHPSGWRLRIPLANGMRHLVVAASGDDPREWVADDTLPVALHLAARLVPGLRRPHRIGNCVAIGDAAVSVEPIGGWPLALLAREIDLLTALLPEHDACPALERAHGDRLARAAEEVRDMAALSHHLAWRRTARGPCADAPALPRSAEAFLAHFEQRGTLPRRDHAFVTDDEWYAFLIGFGARTSAPDPLAAEVTRAQFEQASTAIHSAIASAVAPLPRYVPGGGR